MRRAKPARPEWALKLERLREALGLSQAGLARQLNVSPMATSRWERGINQPNASIYLELGKLAGLPDCWYFWERAGLKKSEVVSAAGLRRPRHSRPTLESLPVFAGKEKIPAGAIPTLLAVPVYGTSAGLGSDQPSRVERDKVTEFIIAPRSWCPHPDRTFAVRAGDNTMAPMLRPESIVAVDEAETDASLLRDKLVLAKHEQHGLRLRWLQQMGPSQVLVPENRDHSAVYIQDGDWKILGRVLWWFATAP